MAFFYEDGSFPWSAKEGEILAYIGNISIEGKVGPKSVRQYVTAISRYHEYRGF